MTAMRHARVDRVVVLAAAALLVIWALVWIRIGIDTSDGGYAVAIQLRVAQGDLPFVDELNPHALGALAGAPFVWLWHQLFGLSGLVLAARVTFVIASVAVCVLAYRALRTMVGPPAAFAGVAVACLAIPYGVPVLSYNTVPILGSVLSASALAATVETGSRRWAVASGAALGVGVLANPQYLPAGIVLGLVAIAWLSARLWIPLLTGAATPLLAFGLWVLAVPGAGRLRDSLNYLRDTRAVMVDPASERLQRNIENLASQLLAPSYLALLVVAGLVTVGVVLRPRSWVTCTALALLPLGALVPVLRVAWRSLPADAPTALTSTGEIGVTPLHGSAAAVGVLLVPGLVWLARDGRRSLLALGSFGLGLGVLVTPLLAASTASGSSRGIAAAGLAVPVLVLVMTAIEAAASVRWPVAAIASVAAVAAMAGTASATTFPGVRVSAADTPMSSGAWAGMLGGPAYVASIRDVGAALARHTDPDDRVLAVSVPAFPLMAEVRAGTPMLWLAFWGEGNRRGLQWLGQPGHAPDVVFVAGYDADSLADDAKLSTDPLAEYIRANFTVVETSTSPPMTVLRRNED